MAVVKSSLGDLLSRLYSPEMLADLLANLELPEPGPPPTRRERIVNWLRYQRRRFATQLHRLGVWIDADSWGECDHAGDHGYW